MGGANRVVLLGIATHAVAQHLPETRADKLIDGAFKAQPIHRASVDSTVLRKACYSPAYQWKRYVSRGAARNSPFSRQTHNRCSLASSGEGFASDAKQMTNDVRAANSLPLFVCGNEAGDLDTIVSALVGAYARSSGDAKVAVPVVPFPRADFRLRGDARMLFEDAGFQMDAEGAPKALTFWDEVDWARLGARAPIMLTDHNKMSNTLSAYFQNVTKIVDHHKDEGLHPEAARSIDPTVGSTCTLVAEEFDVQDIPKDLGTLLLGTILVDTRNLDPKELRFNERDAAQVKKLEGFTPEIAFAHGDPKAWWYKRLMDARFDTSTFPAADLLKLDYKEAAVALGSEKIGVKIGFSAIFETMHGFIERAGGAEGLERTMHDFSEAKSLSILFALTSASSFEGEACKGLVVFAHGGERSRRALDDLMQYLSDLPNGLPESLRQGELFIKQGISSKGFGLVPRHELAPLQVFCFQKLATRKTMLPTVVDFFSG